MEIHKRDPAVSVRKLERNARRKRMASMRTLAELVRHVDNLHGQRDTEELNEYTYHRLDDLQPR
eukprot:8585994-Karenia_brevis.AAC.1